MRKLRVLLPTAFLPFLALFISAEPAGCQSWFESVEAPKKSVWYLGIDLSRSVPEEQFTNYSKIVRQAVLSFLQPEDTVIVLPFPTQQQPTTFSLDSRTSQLKKKVLEIDAHVASFEQLQGRQHGSDLGTILKRANRRILKDIELGQIEKFRYRVALLSDGVLDGTQGHGGESLPPEVDYRILVLGVGDGDEDSIIDLTRKNGFPHRDRIFIAPYLQIDGLLSGLNGFLDLRVNPNTTRIFSKSAHP